MSWLDLDELDKVMALSPFWSLERLPVSFIVAIICGEAGQDLTDAVENRIKEQNRRFIQGRICLVNPFAISGFCFNPVTFISVIPRAQSRPLHSREINNTP